MPLDNLSEQERLRLAQLMKAPLLAPDPPARMHPRPEWPKWDGKLVSRATRHLVAHWRVWITGFATALTCLLFLALAVRLAGLREEETVHLHAGESQGQLQIRWNAASDLVRRAMGAKLFITDGTERLFVTLDPGHLQRGLVTYARQSGRVELRIALAEPDGRTIEQSTIFFAAPPAAETAPQLAAGTMPSAPAPTFSAEPRPAVQITRLEQRSRRKPLVASGVTLPFTCAIGDVFHKTDAPPGWDTFRCQGKNVWSLSPPSARSEDSQHTPSAGPGTVTVHPAGASTT